MHDGIKLIKILMLPFYIHYKRKEWKINFVIYFLSFFKWTCCARNDLWMHNFYVNLRIKWFIKENMAYFHKILREFFKINSQLLPTPSWQCSHVIKNSPQTCCSLLILYWLNFNFNLIKSWVCCIASKINQFQIKTSSFL